MATILVDYENVCSTDGLKGVEYLIKKDNWEEKIDEKRTSIFKRNGQRKTY